MKCNCWFAILHDYDQSDLNYLYLDDYIEKLKSRSNNTKTMHHISPQTFRKISEPLDYIDGRKSMSIMFNFCPECGVKINWKDLRKRLKDEI